MKKRLLPMLLVLVMLLGLLAGCAGKTDPAPSTDPQASDSQTPESTPPAVKKRRSPSWVGAPMRKLPPSPR